MKKNIWFVPRWWS